MQILNIYEVGVVAEVSILIPTQIRIGIRIRIEIRIEIIMQRIKDMKRRERREQTEIINNQDISKTNINIIVITNKILTIST